MKLDELDRYAPLFDRSAASYQSFLRRHDRKRRNRRIGAAAVAIVVMLALVGSFAATYLRSQGVPAKGGAITPQNVGQLRLRWSADLDGSVPADEYSATMIPYPPTVVGDTAYIATDAGTVYAFPMSCGMGGASCEPEWTAHVQGAVEHAVTVADGHVFATTDAGKLYAFPSNCAAACTPQWVGDVGHGFYASPVVADGRVYGIDLWRGMLYSFDEACAPPGPEGDCSPSWTASLGSRLRTNLACSSLTWCVVAAPAVADGMVFAGGEGHHAKEALRAFDSETGELRWKAPEAPSDFIRRFRWPVVVGDRVIVAYEDGLYAFPTRCGTDDATCVPSWRAPTSFEGQPVVSDGQIIVGADAIYAYPVDCRDDGRVCDPTWQSLRPGNLVGMIPGVGQGVLVVPDSPSETDGIATIRVAPSGKEGSAENRDRSPLWTASVGYPFMPTVTNGIVYVGSGESTLRAFPLDCRDTCPPAWTWTGGSLGLSTPAVSEDSILVAERDGRLLSFGIGSAPTESGAWTKGPALFSVTIVVVGIALAAGAIRRRRERRL
jgi:outer membrane protein assembly factor BamB